MHTLVHAIKDRLTLPGLDDPEWRNFLKKWLGISLVLHLVAALLSTGYYHWDEHFQIYEFLYHRLGKATAQDLPFEFRTQIRPWLQLVSLTGLAKLWQAVGIDSPFFWATSFRFLSALIGWLSTVMLALCTPLWFNHMRWRRWAVIALALIWYFPALHARASSENWGGSFFWIGLCLFVLRSRPSFLIAFISGILFGFAFQFRYQVAVMVSGASLWLLIFGRVPLTRLIVLTLGFLIATGLGVWADRWGYGNWVFAPWGYLKFNVIEGHVNDIDTFPWWDFYRRAFTEAWPLLGGLSMLAFTLAWLRHPKHILTWACVPFFLVHMAIGHKELRFVFPIAAAGPVLLALALYSERTTQPLLEKTLKLLVGWNLIALVATTIVPAWMPVRFYQHLHGVYTPGMKLYYVKGQNPFKVIGIPIHYYRPQGIQLMEKENYAELLTHLKSEPGAHWVYYNGFELQGDAAPLNEFCRRDFSMIPQWVGILKPTGLTQRMNNWTLLRCHSV